MSGSRRSTENTAAASVEATTLPRMTAVRARRRAPARASPRHHRDADGDADRRQHDGERQRRPDDRPAGGQPALGQDQRQREQPEVGGELVVGELDAEARLADRQADGQVDEQRRQPGAVWRAGPPDDGDEQEGGWREQDQC